MEVATFNSRPKMFAKTTRIYGIALQSLCLSESAALNLINIHFTINTPQAGAERAEVCHPPNVFTASQMLFQKREGTLAVDGMAAVEVFDFRPVREAILLI